MTNHWVSPLGVKRVRRLTSSIISMNLWASSPERRSTTSALPRSEKIVVIRETHSCALRVWLVNRLQTGWFE